MQVLITFNWLKIEIIIALKVSGEGGSGGVYGPYMVYGLPKNFEVVALDIFTFQ
jgi:hypothetical protein